MSNILENTLAALSVRHTKLFVKKTYDEDPDRDNLRGLSRMLEQFGVHSSGYVCNDYSLLCEEQQPFIIIKDHHFLLVLTMDEENITIQHSSKKVQTYSCNSFFKNHSNFVVLLLNKYDKAVEPNYKEHTRYERNEAIKVLVLLISIGTTIGFLLLHLSRIVGAEEWVFLGLNIAALISCGFLIEKQVFGESAIGDKICTVVKENGCDAILNSSAAKPFLSISWSELGFGYFLFNAAIVLLNPDLIPSLTIICLCSGFVSIWCIVYQFIRKEWCPLCLFTHICVILQCIEILCCKMAATAFLPSDMCMLILPYSILILSLHYGLRYCLENKERKSNYRRIYSLVTDTDVFNCRLKQQPFINVSYKDSSIIIGNRDAPNTLTVFTNPGCTHCVEVHRKISSVLDRLGAYRIQYVFAAFTDELERESKVLISCYLNSNDSRELMMDEWFENGHKNPERFIKVHGGIYGDKLAEEEMEKHKKWAANNGLASTPTLLLNGNVLPKEYSVTDLVYIDM